MNRFETLPKRTKAIIVSVFTVLILLIVMSVIDLVSLGTLVAHRLVVSNQPLTSGWVKQIGFFYNAPGNTLSNFAIPDPFLGYRLAPNVQLDAWDSNTGEKIGVLKVNQYGFVKNNDDFDDDEPIDSDDFTIVITGGSTVAGNGVPKNSLTISSVLERLLNTYSPEGFILRQPVRVINAGQPGHNSSQEIINMVFDLAYLEPEIWIMFNGINERWYLGELEGATNWHHDEGIVGRTKPSNSSNFRIPLGGFFPATRYLVDQAKDRLPKKIAADTVAKPGYLNNELLLRRGAERYSRNIETSAAIARSQNMGFIYALQPTSGAGNRIFTQEEVSARQRGWPETRWQQYQQFGNLFYDESEIELEKLQSKLADSGSVKLSSMRNVFDQVDERVYADPRHYTAIGNEIIASHLSQIIVELFAEDLYQPAAGS